MRLTKNDGLRKVAIFKCYETLKESEQKYQEKHNECEIYNKLADLEDIEDELGIDLITFIKALKKGCYYKDRYGAVIRCDKPKVKFDNFTILSHIKPTQQVSCLFYVSRKNYFVLLQDYGKTWALTKEELL